MTSRFTFVKGNVYIGLNRAEALANHTFNGTGYKLGNIDNLSAYIYQGEYNDFTRTLHQFREVSPKGFLGEEWLLSDDWIRQLNLKNVKDITRCPMAYRTEPFIWQSQPFEVEVYYDDQDGFGWVLAAKLPHTVVKMAGDTYQEAKWKILNYLKGWADHLTYANQVTNDRHSAASDRIQILQSHLNLAQDSLNRIDKLIQGY